VAIRCTEKALCTFVTLRSDQI